MALKQGPWGGNRGDESTMQPADRITKVEIFYIDAVVGLKITYFLNNETHIFCIGEAKDVSDKVLNLADGEYITKLSGAFHYMWNENLIITELAFETNKGNRVETPTTTQGSRFCLALGGELSKVVGFFGISNKPSKGLVAIGVYVA